MVQMVKNHAKLIKTHKHKKLKSIATYDFSSNIPLTQVEVFPRQF